MKGFPNQVADLRKLATAMRDVVRLEGQMARDDGILGEALVRSRVAGTGHRPQPIDDYLRSQRRKKHSDQSFRTTARGLRELFRILGFITEFEGSVRVTDLGRQAAALAGSPPDQVQIEFWRRTIRNMSHDGGDGEESHPYQVLLKLIASKPGIVKTKCALALEAKNDSPQELTRIVSLAVLREQTIRSRIGVTQSNWANAVKVLPKLAEQLGDVFQIGKRGEYRYQIADAPGRADAGAAESRSEATRAPVRRAHAPRVPRTSREVTPATIATTKPADTFDEVEIPPAIDFVVTAAAIRARRDRRRRHNLLVQKLAARLAARGGLLYEGAFDILAVVEHLGVLVEVKTLDGTVEDERDRVRDALSQLLYYEAFVTRPVSGEATIRKVACFEKRPNDAHVTWLNDNRIGVIWQAGERFAGDDLASGFLRRFLKELR